jgi:hypothetical protein
LAAARVRWFGLIGQPIGRAILIIAHRETPYIQTQNYALAHLDLASGLLGSAALSGFSAVGVCSLAGSMY